MTLHTPSFDRDIDWSFDVHDADVLFRLPAIARHKIKVFRNDTCLQSVSEDYAFDKDRLKAFLAFLFSENCGDGLMFHGPFGCGKTSFVREVLGRLRWPTLMLSWNETSDTADLIGKTGISFGNTVFEPGPLTIAVTKGFVLVVNEIDRGRADTSRATERLDWTARHAMPDVVRMMVESRLAEQPATRRAA